MTKRIRRISDMELVACENLLHDLDHELDCLEKDDPANEAKIDRICSRLTEYEEWALSKPPQSVHGLATQARIARRSCDWADKILAQMDRLIESIHTIPDVSIQRPRIRLRADRSYRKRDGTKTNPLSQMDGRGHMFSDDLSGGIWDAHGRSTSGSPDHDLVEEVKVKRRIARQKTECPSEATVRRSTLGGLISVNPDVSTRTYKDRSGILCRASVPDLQDEAH